MCTYVMSGLDRRHRSDIRDSTIKDGVVELVSKGLNHFGVIAGLFRQIGGHSV